MRLLKDSAIVYSDAGNDDKNQIAARYPSSFRVDPITGDLEYQNGGMWTPVSLGVAMYVDYAANVITVPLSEAILRNTDAVGVEVAP